MPKVLGVNFMIMKTILAALSLLLVIASPASLKAQGRIRFDPLPAVVAQGDPPFRLRARGSGRIVFTSSNTRIARVSGSRIRILRPGRTRITARSANGTSRSVSRQLVVGSRARFFGSSLGVPNLLIGPESAPILDPVSGAPTLVASGQTSCTLRHVGYLGSLQAGSVVPGSGIIRNIRVRCGPNPAVMQAVIMSGSPGLYGTALRTSRAFRPRANAVTTVRVDLRVTRSLSGATNVIDAVGLNVFGPGTMPLRDQGTAGTFANGSALLQHWYPIVRRGEPENGRAYNIDGVELLMSWEYIQIGSGVLR